jgi:circadian clock protein KaiC
VPGGVQSLAPFGGGLTPDRIYLVEGAPGSGKTTMALQFLLEGASRGEPTLHVTLSETAGELRAVAASHGWTLDAIDIFEMLDIGSLDLNGERSILHPSEIVPRHMNIPYGSFVNIGRS